MLCFWRNELGFLDSCYSSDYGETWEIKNRPQPLIYYKLGQPLSSEYPRYKHAQKRAVLKTEGAVVRNDKLIHDSEKYLASEEYRKLVLENHGVVRNPRGAITPHRMRDGHIALLYYNNGHTEKLGYVGRLVVWITLGRIDKGNVWWSQPEIAIWWDGLLLDDREDWNEDWAIVDGAGYHDIQELPNGNLAFVESNKLTVRYHEIPRTTLDLMKLQLTTDADFMSRMEEGPVFSWERASDPLRKSLRAPVLPDLRSGAGFTLVSWIEWSSTSGADSDNILVNGMTTVSGALDEEDATVDLFNVDKS